LSVKQKSGFRLPYSPPRKDYTMVFIFFMAQGIVVACANAGCTITSPAKLAVLAVAGGIELIFEIKGIVGIYKKKV
jgi:hypothetical protein